MATNEEITFYETNFGSSYIFTREYRLNKPYCEPRTFNKGHIVELTVGNCKFIMQLLEAGTVEKIAKN